MANPTAPQEGSGRHMEFLSDPAHIGTPYWPIGTGAISLGGGNTPGAVPGVVPWGLSTNGVHVQHHVADKFKPFSLSAVTTEQKIWDVTAVKFRMMGAVLTADATTNIAFLDGTAGTVIYRVRLLINSPVQLDLGPIGILSDTLGKDLYVTSSASAAIVGTVWGTEEA